MNEIEKIGEIDYAILKSVNYIKHLNITHLDEEIREMAKILQVRTIIIEKHIFTLIKNEFISTNGQCLLTQRGEDAINKYETDNEGWRAIEDFIKLRVENRKERKLEVYKIIDKFLLLSIIVLVIYIIYTIYSGIYL